MQLFEKYRPKCLDDIVGHEASVNALRRTVNNPGWDRDTFWIHGPSGTGKTSLAGALINHVKADDRDVFRIQGCNCLIETVRELEYSFQLATWGDSGWKVAVIDEAHVMSGKAATAWLTFLEGLRPKRLVIFTSIHGLESDLYGEDTSAFGGRCKKVELTYGRCAEKVAFSRRLQQIAEAEDLGGAPAAAYCRLIDECKGSFRAALQKIEGGACLVRRPEPAPPAQPDRIAEIIAHLEATQTGKVCVS